MISKRFDNYKYMYKNLWQWDKKSYLLCFIRSVLIILLPLCMALIPKVIIDLVMSGTPINRFVAITIGLSLLICTISWIEPYIKEKLSAATENSRVRYRIVAFKKLLNMNYAELESNEQQKKYEKAKMFIYAGKYTPLLDFLDINSTILSSAFGILFYSLIISKINPYLIIFIVLVCALEYGLSIYLKKYEFRVIGDEIGIYAKFDYLYRISVDDKNGKDIRLFSAQNFFSNVLKNLLKTHGKVMTSITKKTISNTVLESVLSLARDITIYFFLIAAVINGNIGVSDFVFLFGITTGFNGWVTALSQQMISFYEINKQCGYYRDFIAQEFGDENENEKEKGIVIDKIEKIEFKNVSFSYDGVKKILNNISFILNDNESTALVGCNGAGKTTIIKLLCGFYEPQEGEILINDTNINYIQKNSLLKLIGAVFQDYTFLPMEIQHNITMQKSKHINYEDMYYAAKQAGIYDKITNLTNSFNAKMEKQIYEDAVEFSGGENQKLLLARALYKNTDLLILDEPTSALDPIAESRIYEQYRKMTNGKISVFVSHRLASTQFCDKILFLNNGSITESGSHGELLKNKGDYWKMYNTQSYFYRKGSDIYEN